MPNAEVRMTKGALRVSSFVIDSAFGFRHSDFTKTFRQLIAQQKGPADAHQRGQFHETHGVELRRF